MAGTTNAMPCVGELMQALAQLDRDLPVVVSTHHDNDIGWSCEMSLEVTTITHDEGPLWRRFNDPTDPNPPRPLVNALVITARA